MKLAGASLKSREHTIYPHYPSLKDQRFGVGSLEILSFVMVTDDDAEAIMSLIKSYAKSLKILDFTIPSKVPVDPLTDVELIFDVSTMSLLEELSVECSVFIERDVIMSKSSVWLGWVSSHLKTIPRGRNFKNITLRLHLDHVFPVGNRFIDIKALQHFENLIVWTGSYLRRNHFLSYSKSRIGAFHA
ncbi:hypothetical protein D9613_008805 [Agrocybe pediades]|uniref:Uncharacterized protein n=1 Tax=Agrocybe pediades TaxID=84607 RepID=A0A8H4QTK8_9AGAR|nr:hypothetical protein D9613_008805 [Agrocybe pediades]